MMIWCSSIFVDFWFCYGYRIKDAMTMPKRYDISMWSGNDLLWFCSFWSEETCMRYFSFYISRYFPGPVIYPADGGYIPLVEEGNNVIIALLFFQQYQST